MKSEENRIADFNGSVKIDGVLKIRVRDVMTKDVVVVGKFEEIDLAVKRLSEHAISGLPVVDRENRVLGVVSEADILSMLGMKKGHTFMDVIRHVLGEPLPERKMGHLVGDIMTLPAITILPDADISEAAAIMDARRIKRLPVADKDNKLIGIISRGDLVRVMSGH